jgi:TetR/AcrR family transcriptional regulator
MLDNPRRPEPHILTLLLVLVAAGYESHLLEWLHCSCAFFVQWDRLSKYLINTGSPKTSVYSMSHAQLLPSARSREVRRTAREFGEASSRSAILEAATYEFARMGLAGARIQSIATAAGVNIALLYYYFETKEKLYAAVLEQVFAEWAQRVGAALDANGSPKQKLTAYVEAYFDFVAEAPHRPRLVHQEMTQLGRSGIRRLNALATKYVRPVHQKVLQLLRQGRAEGEFRHVTPDFVYSISAIIVSYFTSSSFIQVVSGRDPLAAAQIAQRRKSVIDTLSAALFRPRFDGNPGRKEVRP